MVAIERVQERSPLRSQAREETNDTGRRAAFERFTQSHLDNAYRLAGAVLRETPEAEDAVHDAAVAAWLHWDDIRDVNKRAVWFDRILVNECRARLRRRRIRPLVIDEAAHVAGRNLVDDIVESDALHAALAALDAEHRIVVVLRYLAGFTSTQIAATTGTREGTVKSRLHYALRQMRATLEAAERTTGGSDERRSH